MMQAKIDPSSERYVRLGQFENWLSEKFPPQERIIISGFLSDSTDALELPLLELGNSTANTVRLLIQDSFPLPASVGPVSPTAPESTAQQNSNRRAREKKDSSRAEHVARSNWAGTWAKVLVASALATPTVDPVRLWDVLRDKRRIRFFCDTNALTTGIASWLLLTLDHKADLVTSSVVDRELVAWPDRHGDNFWMGSTSDAWTLRTQYLLARRLIECPPEGVVIDRLSPHEQSALMLAKTKDESASKSPDADMLLIEVARAYIRDQSRHSRLIFLTGDLNNARSAASALGADNVLFASVPPDVFERSRGHIIGRGWWHPDGPLGAILVPRTAALVWDLLSACTRLVLRDERDAWLVTAAAAASHGVPSDWADPWLRLRRILSGSNGSETDSRPPESPGPAPAPSEPISRPQQGMMEVVIDHAPVDPHAHRPMQRSGKLDDNVAPHPLASVAIVESSKVLGPDDYWLLEPASELSVVDVSSSARPTSTLFFDLTWNLIANQKVVYVKEERHQLQREVLQILTALGWTNGPDVGPAFAACRTAWFANDLEWFHRQLLRVPGYREALLSVGKGEWPSLGSRPRAHVALARSLGQVASLQDELLRGDSPVSKRALLAALNRWLPNPEDSLPTESLAQLAARDLGLTPFRFEIAMDRLWRKEPIPFDGASGGVASTRDTEEVAVFQQSGYTFRKVSPGALTFGRGGPVRFVRRTA